MLVCVCGLGLEGAEGRRTVAVGCGLVVEVVAHYGGGVVEEGGDFGVGLVVEDFEEEVGVVAAAGLDEEFFDRGALAFLLDGWFWIGGGCWLLPRVLRRRPWWWLCWWEMGFGGV